MSDSWGTPAPTEAAGEAATPFGEDCRSLRLGSGSSSVMLAGPVGVAAAAEAAAAVAALLLRGVAVIGVASPKSLLR